MVKEENGLMFMALLDLPCNSIIQQQLTLQNFGMAHQILSSGTSLEKTLCEVGVLVYKIE